LNGVYEGIKMASSGTHIIPGKYLPESEPSV